MQLDNFYVDSTAQSGTKAEGIVKGIISINGISSHRR